MSSDRWYVGPARTPAEVVAARQLAARVMEPATAPEAAAEHKRWMWDDPSRPGIDHVIVAADRRGAIDATVRLVPRTLRRASETILVAGISSVSVAEDQRGRGLSREVMMAALGQANALGYELTALFARRAVDHFYERFDIWGLASYSRLTINTFPPAGVNGACVLRPMLAADLPLAARWHAASYGDCFGWFERSVEQWQFLLIGAARRHLAPLVAEIDGVAVGYVVRDGDRVIELGFESARDGVVLARTLWSAAAAVDLDLSQEHALLELLAHADFRVSHRRCVYGGHMVGVINRDRACARLASRVQRRAVRCGFAPRLECVDGLRIEWDGRHASVRLDQSADGQPLGAQLTARLAGASQAGAGESSLLAPGAFLSFLSFDEF